LTLLHNQEKSQARQVQFLPGFRQIPLSHCKGEDKLHPYVNTSNHNRVGAEFIATLLGDGRLVIGG